MATTVRRSPRHQRSFLELLFSPWILIPSALAIGWLLATQTVNVQPRYVKLLFGMAVALVVIRQPLYRSLAIFTVVFVVPTFIFIGDTNVIFIALLVTVWLVQVVLGRLPRPLPTPIDWAILGYLGIHALSFINIDDPKIMVRSLETMAPIVAGTLLYRVFVNGIRTEAHLLTVFKAMCLTAFFVDITGLVEYWWAGYRLIPEWFLYTGGQSTPSGERIGGIFGSHALLSDWSAMMCLLQIMLGLRSTSRAARTWYFSLAVLSVIMIALTVNRGGAVIWAVGLLYFGILMRDRVPWMKVAFFAPVALAIVIAVQNLGTGRFGNIRLVARLAGTQLERGVPETRVKAWSDILSRVPDHLWIGHGPHYSFQGTVGTEKIFWPHSAYLYYLFTTGVVGMLIWIWILFKLIWKTFPGWHIDFKRAPLGKAATALIHVQLIMFAAAQARSDHQRGNVYLYVMWILFALAVVSMRLARESSAKPSHVKSPH